MGTLARGLHLLSSLASAGRELGVTELAQAAGLDKATTYRLAVVLTRLGYMEQERETRRFRLGLRILDLGFGYLASLDVRRQALPEMRLLRQDSDGTISLSVLDGTDIVYVERLPPKRLQASAPVGIGARLSVHCTAMGKAILAFLPADEAEAVLARLELKAWTPYTITDVAELRRQLDEARRRGFALSEQETVLGLRSVAAPIIDRNDRPLAALSVAVGIQDVSQEDLQTRVAACVAQAAAAVSSHLGHPPSEG